MSSAELLECKNMITKNMEELRKHSDKRDDKIEKKLDEIINDQKIIDDFLRNGLSDRIIKAVTDHLDKMLANNMRWLFRVTIPILITAIIGITIKLIFF